jgi:4'-phosphopantetheinyl transferase
LPSLSLPVIRAGWSLVGEAGTETPDLFQLRLADLDGSQLDPSVLDADEQARARALVQPADRRRFVAAHLVLRQLLGERLGLRPEELTYRRQPCPNCGGPHGRPAVDRVPTPLHFSLSHSGGYVLVGISSSPVGVDIEALPRWSTVAEVSSLLHPDERAEVAAAAPAERRLVFARIWTRKEAYLKGIGSGVAVDLAADYLGTEERAAGPKGWVVATVPTGAGHVAAAAVVRNTRSSGA